MASATIRSAQRRRRAGHRAGRSSAHAADPQPEPLDGKRLRCAAELECRQLTGASGERRRRRAVSRVPETETVVTASAGDHALGVAFPACRSAGPQTSSSHAESRPDEGRRPGTVRVGRSTRGGRWSYDDTERAARYAAEERPGTVFVSSSTTATWSPGSPRSARGDHLAVAAGRCRESSRSAGGWLLSGVALACAEHDRRSPPGGWSRQVQQRDEPARAGRIVGTVKMRHRRRRPGWHLDRDSITFLPCARCTRQACW